MESTTAPAMRADAARNRARILAVADEVFAQKGVAATMADVADAAGLGVGTLYRRFGSRERLLEEVFARRIDEFSAVIAEAAAHASAGAGLSWLLRRYVELQSRSHVMQHLFSTIAGPATDLLRERVAPALIDLVDRAKAEGAVRSDFAATDIPILTSAISTTAHRFTGDAQPTGERLAQRYLELALKGIAATPDAAAVPGPLSDDDFVEWMRSGG